MHTTTRPSWTQYLLRAFFGPAAVALAVFVAVPAMTQDAPVGGYANGDLYSAPAAKAPSWSPALGREFPGCSGRLHSTDRVVVIKLDGHPARMSFDEAWQRGHNEAYADDVWTVGWC